MPIRRPAAAALVCWTLAAAAGCQGQSSRIIRELPVDPIATAAPVRAGQAGRPAARGHALSAKQTPSAWVPKTTERPWRWIVVHHSASDFGSAKIFDHWHRRRGWDELGYHFVITNGSGGTDGKVEVGSRWVKQKWGAHCKTRGNLHNDYGIGICLVGSFCDQLPSTAQLASLRKLTRFLARRYRISPANVIGHRDAPGASTRCPGEALHRWLHTTLRPHLARTEALTRR